jgi:hypothetical protein
VANIQDGSGGGHLLTVESTKAARMVSVPRGQQFCVSDVTGTVGAALAQNSSVFGMRIDPGSALRAFVDRVVLRYTTIVAYGTPVTAGRRLALFRGSGAGTSGGTSITTATPLSTGFAASEFDTASGGAMSISTTGALTVTGITYETAPIAVVPLVHLGAAGAFGEFLLDFSTAPIQLEPGQLLAVRNPVAMDATGTWQLGVYVQWREAAQLL